MPNLSNWLKFKRDDGSIVRCLVNGGYLEQVVVEDSKGNSLDIPPQMVDINVIAEGLGFRPKLH